MKGLGLTNDVGLRSAGHTLNVSTPPAPPPPPPPPTLHLQLAAPHLHIFVLQPVLMASLNLPHLAALHARHAVQGVVAVRAQGVQLGVELRDAAGSKLGVELREGKGGEGWDERSM